jgi:hypothetical protein
MGGECNVAVLQGGCVKLVLGVEYCPLTLTYTTVAKIRITVIMLQLWWWKNWT